ncbi:MAG: phage virion morphogenesis protein [archaeon]
MIFIANIIMIELKITGIEKTLTNLDTFSKSLENRTKPLNEAGQYMLVRAHANITSQGGEFAGESWAPLAKSTIEYKSRYFPGTEGTIMQRTGDLINSFSYHDISTGKSIAITNAQDYWVRHQSPYTADRAILPFGNENAQETVLPRRVLLKIDSAAESSITDIFRKWAGENINKNFN